MHITSEGVDSDADVSVASFRFGELGDQVGMNMLHWSGWDWMTTQWERCFGRSVTLSSGTVYTPCDVLLDIAVHIEPVVLGSYTCAKTPTAWVSITFMQKFQAQRS